MCWMLFEMPILAFAAPAVVDLVGPADLKRTQEVLLAYCCSALAVDLICDVELVFYLALKVNGMPIQPLAVKFVEDLGSKIAFAPEQVKIVQVEWCCNVIRVAVNLVRRN